jgi:site-specific recombinase XerC
LLLESWKMRTAKTGVKAATIANKLHAVQGLLRIAIKAGHLADNPAKAVPATGALMSRCAI